MHPSRIPHLLLCLLTAIIGFAAAVPSVTDHREHVRYRHIGHRNPTTDTIVSRQSGVQQSAWSRAYGGAKALISNLLDRDTESELEFPRPSRPGPPRKLAIQYQDQVVLRFTASSKEDLVSLREASDTLFLDVWASGVDWVDIRLAKDVVPSLLSLLPESLRQSHKPLLDGRDLAHAIYDSYPESKVTSSPDGFSVRRAFAPSILEPRKGSTDVFFNEYQPPSVIYHWSRLLQSMFPDLVHIVKVGTSYEGRDIDALRVGVHDKKSSKPRKTIVVVGGQHAREWISVSTVNYVAWTIIKKYGKDKAMTHLLQDVDFLFVPVLNPDGYQYTFDVDRLWRKTRCATSLAFCPGIDLDRSWDFEWDGEQTIDNPCSENYAGTFAWDAVEARSFSEWLKNEKLSGRTDFIGLLDLHSYAQEILYPYSYSCGVYPPSLEDLMETAEGLAKNIRESERDNYKVRSACEGNIAGSGEILPQFGGGGGSLLDWFYHELGVRDAFQIKLRDKGVYGFLLPKEYIIPTGSEIYSAVIWLADRLVLKTSKKPEMTAGDSQTTLNAELR